MSDKIFTGNVWKYGDNINTDIISPPAYMELSIKEASRYAMSPIDTNFSQKFKKGDILVAENNFGSGSSRETAPLTLREIGVYIIIAKSFARIFYRNSINIGILVLECSETHKIEDRDELEVDYLGGKIKNITKNEIYKCTKMPEHIMKIINAKGLVPFLEEHNKDREEY